MSWPNLLPGILLLLLSSVTALSQAVPGHPNETGLVLEVVSLKDTPPSYDEVRRPDSQAAGNWYARFGRIVGRSPDNSLPVRAVRILPTLRGQVVAIKVSVLRGEKYQDVEDIVGVYEARENEKISVEALKNVGIEPFELRVIRINPLASNLPATESLVASVGFVGIEPVNSTLPRYKLTFQNLSSKSVDALNVQLMEGDRVVITGMPQGREGNALMTAGQTAEWLIPVATGVDKSAGGYTPSVPMRQRVVVTAVLFSDGTEEGTPRRAGFQHVKFGRKIELRRLLVLLEDVTRLTGSDSLNGPAKLRQRLDGLSFEPSEQDLAEFGQLFPGAGRFPKEIELGIHLMRKDLVDRLQRFEESSRAEDFSAWLVANQERYSNWLSRLDTPPVSKN